eukprot:444821-Prymnesium_polylepis.1
MAPPRPALSPVAGEVGTRLASRLRRWTCQFGHVLYIPQQADVPHRNQQLPTVCVLCSQASPTSFGRGCRCPPAP